jgi:imidazolonepropionase-like amidohydrolase
MFGRKKHTFVMIFSLLISSYILSDENYAVVSNHLIDGKSDQIRHNLAVIISNNKISKVVDRNLVPKDIRLIDLGNSTLMPGLINAHEHPLLHENDYQTAHLKSSSAYKALIGLKTHQGLLASGWTTIRVMGDGDVFYANQDIKKAIENKIFIGPRITGAAHYISITGGGGDINYMSPEQTPLPDGLIADGPQEIIKAIRKEIKYGSDWIKIMVTGAFMSVGDNPENVSFSPEELKAAVDEAKRHGIPVAAHAHATEGINQAIRAGVRSIEHGTYLDEESISLMVKYGTFYVPTIYVGDYYANSGKLLAQEKNDDYYLSYRSEWLSMIEKAYLAGVKITVGSDLCGYGIEPSLCVREFATLVEAGMTPMDAIKAGTIVGAELVGWDDELGSIESGKLADIIAVEGNPLEDISVLESPILVIKDGEIIINKLDSYSALEK